MLFKGGLNAVDAQFYAEVCAFLDDNLDPAITAAEDVQRSMVADYHRGTAWINTLRPRRWHAAHWPEAHGGAGLSAMQNYCLLYEMGVRGAPLAPPMGLNYVGPVLIEFGHAEQHARLLPRVLDGSD